MKVGTYEVTQIVDHEMVLTPGVSYVECSAMPPTEGFSARRLKVEVDAC